MSRTAPRHITELFPDNVARLTELGIRFAHRPSSHDIVTTCPACGGKFVMDETEPFWLCLGDIRCPSNRKPFNEVVAALVEKAEKP